MFGSEPDLKIHVQNYLGVPSPKMWSSKNCLFSGGFTMTCKCKYLRNEKRCR